MNAKYIIAVDQSTTGTKALLIDSEGNINHRCYLEHKQILPASGWVEHNPYELLENIRTLLGRMLDECGLRSADIQCIALTNQRETVLAWDKETGRPVYNAIVWQCNRASAQCAHIREMGLEKTVTEKTGLPLSEFFSASKLAWIIDNIPEAVRLRNQNRLACGTVDTWIVWNLSRERKHITDYTNASRTQLFNINTLDWDKELVEAFGLSIEMLPDVISSDTVVGHMDLNGRDIPIAGVIGDSHGALFAQSGLKMGMKVTYGTGSSIMLGTGEKIVRCGNLASTVAYAFNSHVYYALEGNINSTGATLKWVTDKLELIEAAGDAEKMACSLKSNGGVYFVPAFGGLGAPHWEPSAKAVIYGMSFDSDKRHIVRSALESIAFQIADVVTELERSGVEINELHVDGKPTENKFLMKFQAGITGKRITKNRVEEASAYGASLMAGLATKYWKIDDINGLIRYGETIKPNMSEHERESMLNGWREAVRASIGKF
jgi:glycerol kinase